MCDQDFSPLNGRKEAEDREREREGRLADAEKKKRIMSINYKVVQKYPTRIHYENYYFKEILRQLHVKLGSQLTGEMCMYKSSTKFLQDLCSEYSLDQNLLTQIEEFKQRDEMLNAQEQMVLNFWAATEYIIGMATSKDGGLTVDMVLALSKILSHTSCAQKKFSAKDQSKLNDLCENHGFHRKVGLTGLTLELFEDYHPISFGVAADVIFFMRRVTEAIDTLPAKELVSHFIGCYGFLRTDIPVFVFCGQDVVKGVVNALLFSKLDEKHLQAMGKLYGVNFQYDPLWHQKRRRGIGRTWFTGGKKVMTNLPQTQEPT